MRGARVRWLLLACLLLVAGSGPQLAEGEDESPRETYARTPDALVPYGKTADPYRHFYVSPPLHRGPGREDPEPAGLESVRIGVLAPLEESADVDYGISLLRGVQLALGEANAAGGYRDRMPFELVAKNDQQLWGASSDTLIELAYVDRVWVMIGSIDSNSTHVALRAALKAELPIVNVGSTDPTMTETGIPWIVRVTPDDRQLGYHLATRIFVQRGFQRVAVVRSSDRYGRFGVKEFRDAARRLARPLPLELLVRPGQQELDPTLERLAASRPEAVVLWVHGPDAARLIRRMRARGIDAPVFGTDRLAHPQFLELAGEAAEGVEAAVWTNPPMDDPGWLAFDKRYRERFGAAPDLFAAYAYDATRLVVATIRSEGLNRARIRDALTAIREYRGVTGTMIFDATSNNVTPVATMRVRGGRLVQE